MHLTVILHLIKYQNHMKDLLKLFSILQLTKEQPETGYLVAGIKLHETASLAEHHYTCVLMAYFIAQEIKKTKVKFNERKLILMLLVHDLGELFGGDISSPLSRKFPDLREHKDKIGNRAIELLSSYLNNESQQDFIKLYQEFETDTSDEKWVGKIIDQIDHQFFLEHHNYKQKYCPGNSDYRVNFIKNHIYKLADKIQNEKIKETMKEFLEEFETNYFNKGFQGITLLME